MTRIVQLLFGRQRPFGTRFGTGSSVQKCRYVSASRQGDLGEKKANGGDRKSVGHSDPLIRTSERVAAECGICKATIPRRIATGSPVSYGLPIRRAFFDGHRVHLVSRSIGLRRIRFHVGVSFAFESSFKLDDSRKTEESVADGQTQPFLSSLYGAHPCPGCRYEYSGRGSRVLRPPRASAPPTELLARRLPGEPRTA